MLYLAAGARARRIRGEESERVRLVTAVLGQVQAHLADGVPRGVARAQPRGTRARAVSDRPSLASSLTGAVSASNAPDGRMATCIARNLSVQPRAASMSGFCCPPSISIIEPLTKWASGEAR